MALQTWVARFVVDHGRVTEEGGRLRTFQRRRLDEPDVDLHVLAEPAGEKGDDLGSQALDAIGRLFLQDRLSLTGGLLRALRSTHQTLLDWNRRSLPRDQVSLGLTGAIVSGNVVYLAQAGPSLVYRRTAQDGSLRRLEPEDAAVSPLGEGGLEPALARFELAPGDVLIAASLAIEDVLDEPTLEGLLDRGSDEALPELYLMTRDLPNFALFAVTCHETEEDPAADASLDDPVNASSNPRPRQPPVLSRVEGPVLSRVEGPAPSNVEGPVLSNVEGSVVSRADAPSLEADAADPAPEGRLLSAPPPLDISRPVVRLRNDQSIGRSDYARTTGPAPRLRVNLSDWRLLRFGAAIAIVLLVVAFVPDLVRQGRSEKLETLVLNAQTQFDASQAEQDPAEKRHFLEETRRLAGEALRIDPANQTAGALRQQAVVSLEAMNSVLDLDPLTTVTTLSRQVTGEVSLEGLSVAGGSAYLLDAKGGRVIAVPLASPGPPTFIYKEGETYGGTPAKKPTHLAWEGGEGGRGRLLILDAERKLFQVRPGGGPEPLPLRRTNTWSDVAGVAAYDGNFYVLDPKGNQVHRYLPAATGFDSEPGPSLAGQQNLADAQGLAVDGDIFVYFKDGAVRRYRNGNDIGFGLGGIDRPLKTAISIALVPAAGEVYLADAGNKRIVVAAKDGTFRRQLISNAFTDLRAIAIDPAGAQLYVVVGDALLTAPIVSAR